MSEQPDNLFENFEEESTPTTPVGGGKGGSGGSNRTFLIAVGIIGGVTLLVVIVGVILLMVFRSGKTGIDEAALINAQNTMTVQAATEAAYAAGLLLTPSATLPPTATVPPTPTPVIVFPSATPTVAVTGVTETPPAVLDIGARTATVAALLTQAAMAGTPTVLPTTGFADQVGLPGLFGLALLFVAIIFIARRMRLSANRTR
jgi:hypothetical protein